MSFGISIVFCLNLVDLLVNQEATKLRKGDLDHIVDEADEGDEAAAEQARLNQLIAQDRQNTKAVIEGITNGYDPTRRNGKKGIGCIVKHAW